MALLVLLIVALSAAAILHFGFDVIRTLLFDNLARFPGPFFSRFSIIPNIYFDIYKQISWHKRLDVLHKTYGPVVRIAPRELHFDSPQAYLDIYNNQNRWDKDPEFYSMFDVDSSSFGHPRYVDAKKRKDAVNRSFSAVGVRQAAPMIEDHVNQLSTALRQASQQDQLVNLNFATRSMTLDIIMYLCFGKSMNAIQAPDFQAPILLAVDEAVPAFNFVRYFPTFRKLMNLIPPQYAVHLVPKLACLMDMKIMLGQQIAGLSERPSTMKDLPHNMTIFHSLMDPANHKDGKIPSNLSMFEEGIGLLGAGSDTTGNTLMVAVFHLVKNPEIVAKLRAELANVWPPDPTKLPDLGTLEDLPYLTAVSKESLRLNYGTVVGLPRIVPPEGAVIDSTFVPGGTVVSSDAYSVHTNPKIFPDPLAFSPDRWLDSRSGLDTYLVAFSKGPRSCIGINLAWAELRLCLAALVHRFDFDIDSRSPETLEFKACFPPHYLKHVFMKVKSL